MSDQYNQYPPQGYNQGYGQQPANNTGYGLGQQQHGYPPSPPQYGDASQGYGPSQPLKSFGHQQQSPIPQNQYGQTLPLPPLQHHEGREIQQQQAYQTSDTSYDPNAPSGQENDRALLGDIGNGMAQRFGAGKGGGSHGFLGTIAGAIAQKLENKSKEGRNNGSHLGNNWSHPGNNGIQHGNNGSQHGNNGIHYESQGGNHGGGGHHGPGRWDDPKYGPGRWDDPAKYGNSRW